MLTTASLDDPSPDRAIGELIDNARRLAAAGCADEALRALRLLLQAGPWRLPAHGGLVHQLQRLLPPVCLLSGQPCPPVGEQAGMSQREQAQWAEQEAGDQVRSLALAGRRQLAPAGAGWSPEFLTTLAQRRGGPAEPQQHRAFGAFCIDAEWVLEARVADRFGISTAPVGGPSRENLEALGLPESEVARLLAQLSGATSIEIAAAAQAIDTLEIARATTAYLAATGFAGGYLEPIFAAAWLLLVDEGRDEAAVEVAGAWLRQDGQALARVIDLAPVPSVRRFLQGGALGPLLRVDVHAAQAWLARLASRRAPEEPKAEISEPASPQRLTHEALLNCIRGTALQSLRWMELPVPDSRERVWAAPIAAPQRKALWQAARLLVDRTGSWPIVTTLWSASGPAHDPQTLADELFNRFPYQQGPARDDVSPRSFIATSRSIAVEDVLADLAAKEYDLGDEQRLQSWRQEMAALGLPLDGFNEAWRRCGGDRLRFEHWLAEQEAGQGLADPERGRQTPFEPDNAWLLLLPTPASEHALAYLHWFGIERGSADGFIRLLRAWRERCGAELFAHYGTMLEFVVERPPADFDAALRLAREHELAAPCTLMLPGIALRHHALGLVGSREWHLHERP